MGRWNAKSFNLALSTAKPSDRDRVRREFLNSDFMQRDIFLYGLIRDKFHLALQAGMIYYSSTGNNCR
jgi:hypothetical protein